MTLADIRFKTPADFTEAAEKASAMLARAKESGEDTTVNIKVDITLTGDSALAYLAMRTIWPGPEDVFDAAVFEAGLVVHREEASKALATARLCSIINTLINGKKEDAV